GDPRPAGSTKEDFRDAICRRNPGSTRHLACRYWPAPPRAPPVALKPGWQPPPMPAEGANSVAYSCRLPVVACSGCGSSSRCGRGRYLIPKAGPHNQAGGSAYTAWTLSCKLRENQGENDMRARLTGFAVVLLTTAA